MKRIIVILLLIALALLLVWLPSRCGHEQPPAPPTADNCYERAEQMVATWKKEGSDAAAIEKLFQAELAKCSGVTNECAALVGAANADLAWLGRAVLSGSMPPADYLARMRDRTRKMRESRKTPAICEAYAQGDADGDLVPDDRDKCPGSANLERTDASGCPDTSPLPPAPSAEAVDKAAKALTIPVSKACVDAPLPQLAGVLKSGVSPDAQSYLLVVSRSTNQPAGCEVFYQVDIRMRNKSFFLQFNTNDVYTRVFRAKDALTGALAHPTAMTFELKKADTTVPWRNLTFRAIEPGDIGQRYFRVRTVNGNGFSQGWSAYTLVPATTFP
jgi:hypothetical protein